jgi:large conductance mechanosensitive channel
VKKLAQDFKEFILRGNVIDLAVGIIIGIAFGAIVNSLVNDVIMPPIGKLLGDIDFSNLFVNLSGTDYSSLAEAKAAGAPVIAYGAFINTLINFLIIALVLFIIIRFTNRMIRKEKTSAAPPPPTKECPYCLTVVPVKATRCPACTSNLAQ